MRAFHSLLIGILGLFSGALCSCQTATPATRIGQNLLIFNQLSPEQRLLVQQGRICEGMSKDAVFLAWGNPNAAPVIGQQDGQPYEKWVYHTYEPVTVNSVGFGIGGGCHGSWYGGSGMGTSTAYVPKESAWVIFQNNAVVSWESRQ